MESKLMVLVRTMHKKFDLNNLIGPMNLTEEEKDFRVRAMQEELDEYEYAKTLVDQYDALLDLIVFAVGSLERHGFPLLAGFETVMEANTKKELGQNGSKRGGFKRDLVKPAGWVSPESKLKLILDDHRDSCPMSDSKLTPNCFLETPPVVAPSSDGTIKPGFAPKFDASKVRFELMPIGPMLEVADVFGFGAKKYFANSYRLGETVVWSRTYASIMRHMMAFWLGEDLDLESGHSHLAHAGTQLFILMEHQAHNKDKDDRFVRGQQ